MIAENNENQKELIYSLDDNQTFCINNHQNLYSNNLKTPLRRTVVDNIDDDKLRIILHMVDILETYENYCLKKNFFEKWKINKSEREKGISQGQQDSNINGDDIPRTEISILETQHASSSSGTKNTLKTALQKQFFTKRNKLFYPKYESSSSQERFNSQEKYAPITDSSALENGTLAGRSSSCTTNLTTAILPNKSSLSSSVALSSTNATNIATTAIMKAKKFKKNIDRIFERNRFSKERLERYILYEHALYQMYRIINGYQNKLCIYVFELIQERARFTKNVIKSRYMRLLLLKITEGKFKLWLYNSFTKWKNMLKCCKLRKINDENYLNIHNNMKDKDSKIDNRSDTKKDANDINKFKYNTDNNNVKENDNNKDKIADNRNKSIMIIESRCTKNIMILYVILKNVIVNMKRRYWNIIRLHIKDMLKLEMGFNNISKLIRLNELSYGFNNLKHIQESKAKQSEKMYQRQKNLMIMMEKINQIIRRIDKRDMIYGLIALRKYSIELLKNKYMIKDFYKFKHFILIITNIILKKNHLLIRLFFDRIKQINLHEEKKSLVLSRMYEIFNRLRQRDKLWMFTILKVNHDLINTIQNQISNPLTRPNNNSINQISYSLKKTLWKLYIKNYIKHMVMIISTILRKYQMNDISRAFQILKNSMKIQQIFKFNVENALGKISAIRGYLVKQANKKNMADTFIKLKTNSRLNKHKEQIIMIAVKKLMIIFNRYNKTIMKTFFSKLKGITSKQKEIDFDLAHDELLLNKSLRNNLLQELLIEFQKNNKITDEILKYFQLYYHMQQQQAGVNAAAQEQDAKFKEYLYQLLLSTLNSKTLENSAEGLKNQITQMLFKDSKQRKDKDAKFGINHEDLEKTEQFPDKSIENSQALGKNSSTLDIKDSVYPQFYAEDDLALSNNDEHHYDDDLSLRTGDNIPKIIRDYERGRVQLQLSQDISNAGYDNDREDASEPENVAISHSRNNSSSKRITGYKLDQSVIESYPAEISSYQGAKLKKDREAKCNQKKYQELIAKEQRKEQQLDEFISPKRKYKSMVKVEQVATGSKQAYNYPGETVKKVMQEEGNNGLEGKFQLLGQIQTDFLHKHEESSHFVNSDIPFSPTTKNSDISEIAQDDTQNIISNQTYRLSEDGHEIQKKSISSNLVNATNIACYTGIQSRQSKSDESKNPLLTTINSLVNRIRKLSESLNLNSSHDFKNSQNGQDKNHLNINLNTCNTSKSGLRIDQYSEGYTNKLSGQGSQHNYQRSLSSIVSKEQENLELTEKLLLHTEIEGVSDDGFNLKTDYSLLNNTFFKNSKPDNQLSFSNNLANPFNTPSNDQLINEEINTNIPMQISEGTNDSTRINEGSGQSIQYKNNKTIGKIRKRIPPFLLDSYSSRNQNLKKHIQLELDKTLGGNKHENNEGYSNPNDSDIRTIIGHKPKPSNDLSISNVIGNSRSFTQLKLKDSGISFDNTIMPESPHFNQNLLSSPSNVNALIERRKAMGIMTTKDTFQAIEITNDVMISADKRHSQKEVAKLKRPTIINENIILNSSNESDEITMDYSKRLLKDDAPLIIKSNHEENQNSINLIMKNSTKENVKAAENLLKLRMTITKGSGEKNMAIEMSDIKSTQISESGSNAKNFGNDSNRKLVSDRQNTINTTNLLSDMKSTREKLNVEIEDSNYLKERERYQSRYDMVDMKNSIINKLCLTTPKIENHSLEKSSEKPLNKKTEKPLIELKTSTSQEQNDIDNMHYGLAKLQNSSCRIKFINTPSIINVGDDLLDPLKNKTSSSLSKNQQLYSSTINANKDDLDSVSHVKYTRLNIEYDHDDNKRPVRSRNMRSNKIEVANNLTNEIFDSSKLSTPYYIKAGEYNTQPKLDLTIDKSWISLTKPVDYNEDSRGYLSPSKSLASLTKAVSYPEEFRGYLSPSKSLASLTKVAGYHEESRRYLSPSKSLVSLTKSKDDNKEFREYLSPSTPSISLNKTRDYNAQLNKEQLSLTKSSASYLKIGDYTRDHLSYRNQLLLPQQSLTSTHYTKADKPYNDVKLIIEPQDKQQYQHQRFIHSPLESSTHSKTTICTESISMIKSQKVLNDRPNREINTSQMTFTSPKKSLLSSTNMNSGTPKNNNHAHKYHNDEDNDISMINYSNPRLLLHTDSGVYNDDSENNTRKFTKKCCYSSSSGHEFSLERYKQYLSDVSVVHEAKKELNFDLSGEDKLSFKTLKKSSLRLVDSENISEHYDQNLSTLEVKRHAYAMERRTNLKDPIIYDEPNGRSYVGASSINNSGWGNCRDIRSGDRRSREAYKVLAESKKQYSYGMNSRYNDNDNIGKYEPYQMQSFKLSDYF